MMNKRGFFMMLLPFIILGIVILGIFIFGWLFVDEAVQAISTSSMGKYALYASIFTLVIIFRQQISAVLNTILGWFGVKI